MNVYEILIPQLLAAGVVLVIALRVIWQSRRERALATIEHERAMAEIRGQVFGQSPDSPARELPVALRLTLDLTDREKVFDIAQVTKEVGLLIAGVSGYDREYGGYGMILTEAKAEPGRVVLTLTPQGVGGAADRVKKVVEAVNTHFDDTDRAFPRLGPLPEGISSASAEVTLAV